MTDDVTNAGLGWPYGGSGLLIEPAMPATPEAEVSRNSITLTELRDERIADLSVTGTALGCPLIVDGLRAGEQTGYYDWETWVNASIPVNLVPAWGSRPPVLDPSVAITLLKQIRLFVAPWEGDAVPLSRGASHFSEFRQSLAERLVAADSAQRERLAQDLNHAFAVEPLEDGWTHPAEDIVAESLRQPRAQEWLHGFCVGPARSADAASVLLCLGRLDSPGDLVWRVRLVREALATDDVDLRDAAVQAAESWGDRELGYILRRHEDGVPWLHEYVENVIEDRDW